MAIHYIDNITNNSDILRFMIGEIPTYKFIGIDTETTGLDPFMDKVLLIQLKVGEDIYVLNRGKLGKEFSELLMKRIHESGVLCIGHNVKFDMKMLYQDTGIMLENVHDTMVIESIITAGLAGRFVSLKELVLKYCDVVLDKDTRLDFVGQTWESEFTEQQITYSAYDVLYLETIYLKQLEEIERVFMTKTMRLECEVEPVVAMMEIEGIPLDIPYWNKLTELAKKEALILKDKLKDVLFEAIPTDEYENAFQFAKAVAIPITTKYLTKALEAVIDPQSALTWVKENFNINSPKQLQTALYLAGIKVISTDEKVLNKLPKNDIIDTLLEYRGYQKMISTYGDNVVSAVCPITGRIHADFNQLGTASGRFSSGSGDRS